MFQAEFWGTVSFSREQENRTGNQNSVWCVLIIALCADLTWKILCTNLVWCGSLWISYENNDEELLIDARPRLVADTQYFAFSATGREFSPHGPNRQLDNCFLSTCRKRNNIWVVLYQVWPLKQIVQILTKRFAAFSLQCQTNVLWKLYRAKMCGLHFTKLAKIGLHLYTTNGIKDPGFCLKYS